MGSSHPGMRTPGKIFRVWQIFQETTYNSIQAAVPDVKAGRCVKVLERRIAGGGA